MWNKVILSNVDVNLLLVVGIFGVESGKIWDMNLIEK